MLPVTHMLSHTVPEGGSEGSGRLKRDAAADKPTDQQSSIGIIGEITPPITMGCFWSIMRRNS